ncbi:MAG: T9SS type A sorting domain-containing protein [Aureispira sp.]
MKFSTLLGLVTLLLPFLLTAQAPATATPECGISAETAELIRQRLMDNRRAFTTQDVQRLTNGRTITYVPVTIHNVAADAAGTGKTSEPTIMAFLCGLNAIYLDQDVQFFLHSPIRSRVSNFIYQNASTSTARSHMLSYRVPNTLNMIIGASISNPRASWYDGGGDFIFLLQQMLTPAAKTEAHEIGHFFTLNHTFYGWEGLNAEATYGGQSVPTIVPNGFFSFRPEAVARTGVQANCQTAADGFCDTEADYFSDRTACPYQPTTLDPHGLSMNPDESNIMSYASDACVTNFSTEQQAAIAMDIANRTWVSQTPSNTTDITAVPSVVSPQSGGQLGSITNATVRLEWAPVAGATWYYIEVLGTNFPGLWLPNSNDVIYKGIQYNGNTHFNLPSTDLVAGKHYVWRVKALNSVSTCAPLSTYSRFEAVTSITTSVGDLPLDQQMSFKIVSNPITTSFVPVSIYAAEEIVGSVRLFSLDGREVLTLTKQTFVEGESLLQLPANNLANGMYLAVLMTEKGQLQQKIIIQR